MTKLISGIFTSLLFSACLISCTVEKRVHQDGYHISWKHKHEKAKELEKTEMAVQLQPTVSEEEQDVSLPNVHSEETISASTENTQDLNFSSRKKKY